MADTFFVKKRIYYHDTDAGGVVYYGSYLKHLEESRAEYLRSKGVSMEGYAADGVLFPIVHLEIDYKSPARYGDEISVFTKIEKVGNASLEFTQEIKRGETLLLKGLMISACVDKNLKPMRIPETIREKLT